MYDKLKQDMRDAGVEITDGPDLDASDMQKVRDFLYFRGINIGEQFDRYEEALKDMDPEVIAARAAADLANAEAQKAEADRQAAEKAEADATAAEQAEADRVAAEAAAEQAEAERVAAEEAAAAEQAAAEQAEAERLAAEEAAKGDDAEGAE